MTFLERIAKAERREAPSVELPRVSAAVRTVRGGNKSREPRPGPTAVSHLGSGWREGNCRLGHRSTVQELQPK